MPNARAKPKEDGALTDGDGRVGGEPADLVAQLRLLDRVVLGRMAVLRVLHVVICADRPLSGSQTFMDHRKQAW